MLFREFDRLAADRVIAAQRMPDPVVGHEDSRELGMPVEDDAEQVVRLALVPVGGWKEVVHRVDLRRDSVDVNGAAAVAPPLAVPQLPDGVVPRLALPPSVGRM